MRAAVPSWGRRAPPARHRTSGAQPEDLELICRLFTQGQWVPVIDRTYPWGEAAEAHRYVETGHKRGNVVLLVDPASNESLASENR